MHKEKREIMQRLVSFNYKGLRQWGVMTTDGTAIIPAVELEETYFIPLAETMEEFIAMGEEGLLNLAVIIGKRGSNIAAEDAMKYVYGYTIINDVTARDLQKKHEQWFRGKSLDTFCPMGPTVMVGSWPVPFTIYTKVNGHLRQEGSTADLIFSIPKLIEVLSSGMTLLPGDVIATGTPQGVGMGMNPPQFLRKGDEVEITIDPIGTLRNKVK